MEDLEMVLVEFVQHYKAYRKHEVAGFRPATAARLIKAKVAAPHHPGFGGKSNGSPSTQGEPRTPSAKPANDSTAPDGRQAGFVPPAPQTVRGGPKRRRRGG